MVKISKNLRELKLTHPSSTLAPSRLTICMTFVELESPMQHAKFQDHKTSGSGEEDFPMLYVRGSHLGHVTLTILQNSCSLFP